jgi:hemolysin III
MAKRVMQVLDHCAIYFLIAGSYTIISLGAIRRANPTLGWGLFAAEWGLCAVATTLTAIDLKRYRVFSMVCYIAMGWAVLPFTGLLREILTGPGFRVLLAGGIAYTIGAVIYGIGKKKRAPYAHSVFHVFVLFACILHFIAIYCFVL